MKDLFTEEEAPVISRVEFAPFEEKEKERAKTPLSEKQIGQWKELQVKMEAVFGSTTVSLQELASLEEDDLLPLDQSAEAGVEIFANGKRVGLGEVVTVGNRFGIRLVSLEGKE